MNASGILLILTGVVVVAQVTLGNALDRLGLFGGSSSSDLNKSTPGSSGQSGLGSQGSSGSGSGGGGGGSW